MLKIRDEIDKDIDAITNITAMAFCTKENINPIEQFIIIGLRQANALVISLVAEKNGRIIGHIAFSPVSISDGSTGWFGLGPISVLPKYQRQGIGSALINKGLMLLKQKNAMGCCVVGDPQYYNRFNFRIEKKLVYKEVPPEFFLVLPFEKSIPTGCVTFHEGFSVEQRNN